MWLRAFTLGGMAKLRLLSKLRQIADAEVITVDADTTTEAVRAASQTYGAGFASEAEKATWWKDGVRLTGAEALGDQDEVVLIPAVAGANRAAATTTVDPTAFIPGVVLLAAVAASFQDQPIWAAALVAISAFWAVDLESTFAARGKPFAALAVATSSAAGALSAHTLGGWGYGLTVAITVAVCLGWAVAFDAYRKVDSFAPTLLSGVLAATATASMVLAHSGSSPDTTSVAIFLVAVGAGVLAGAVVGRMPALPFLEPFTTTAIVAVLGAVVGALIWDADVVGYLLIGLGIAVALVAGNGLSTMLRTGQVRLTERAPGMMPSLDGVMLAASIYFPLIWVIL